MRAAGGDSSSSRARRSRPSRSRFRASPSAICMLWSTTGISWRFRVTERALARDVVVEGRQDHPRLRYGLENSLLRAGEVAPEFTANIVLPPAHRDGDGRATVEAAGRENPKRPPHDRRPVRRLPSRIRLPTPRTTARHGVKRQRSGDLLRAVGGHQHPPRHPARTSKDSPKLPLAS